MKFRAHDTFFIRKGWLSKGMKHIVETPDVFVSKTENPMDVLGIGANMVKSLRYWMQAVGIAQEPNSGQRIQTLTELGECIFKYDRYIEEIGTLQVLHYKLVSNFEEATAWYYFFNLFNMSEFTREEFVQSINNYVSMSEDIDSVALRSLNDDFTCIINTYVPRYKTNPGRVSPESNIDCPLGELELVDIFNKEKRVFRKSAISSKDINPWIAFAIVIDQAKGKDEISLNELLTEPCNIGKTYNLDAMSMLEILHSMEKLGFIKIIRTAGLDVIQIIDKKKNFIDCIEHYYLDISSQI